MTELIWDAFAVIGVWFTGSVITLAFWVAARRGRRT